MNIQERIEALETEFNEKIKALKAEVQREDEFPQEGDSFYSISETGNIEGGMIWGGYPVDMNRMAIGNVFKTEQQAEFVVEKLKVEAELRKFSRPFVDGEWNNHIKYSQRFDELSISTSLVYQTQGVIYFESGEKARQAIKSVGEERIKKYIFGVEELK